MTDVIRDWLLSGHFICIEGIDLLPLSVEEWPGTPLALRSSRAEVYYLKDLKNQLWVIKKFLTNSNTEMQYRSSIRSLLPHRPGFESGYLRKVLNQASISGLGVCNLRLSIWIENAILMPAVVGFSWADLTDIVRAGRQYLPKKHCIMLVRKLSERIKWLEGQDVSHRGLANTSIYVDVRNADVHLTGWDTMFHPSLPTPDNLTHVDAGYIPPFVKVRGSTGARNTWRLCTDRFSMTLLNTEFLTIGAESPPAGKGTIWDQDEIYNRSGPSLAAIISRVGAQFPKAAGLLKQALEATSFDDCPAPADWIAAMRSEPTIKAMLIPVKDRATFVGLNKAGFTKLNKSRFAGLKRHAFMRPPHR